MMNETRHGTDLLPAQNATGPAMGRVVIFTSCDSFEGFYGGTFGLDRQTYLSSYRNDFVWEYAQGLRRCGHEVFIYILSYGDSELRQVYDGVHVRFLHLPLWLRMVDPILWRLRGFKRGPTLRDRVAYLGYGSELQSVLGEDRIGVMYHQEIWTSRFDIVVEKTAVPIIGADQGAVYADWMENAKRRSLRLAAKLICQSHTGLERTRRLGANAELMYNGVDTQFFFPPDASKQRSKTVLAVGRLVEDQKRFADLLHAMQLLPDFTLTLVGSGPDEMKLKRLAEDLGIAGRVSFAGFVSNRKELRSLYQGCGVFVSTSRWEAVALVLLEAMSCGAPVVATQIPSFLDLLTDGTDGLLVPVGAPEKLAPAICRAYEEQRELGAHARKTVEKGYSSPVLYGRLSSLIEVVCGSHAYRAEGGQPRLRPGRP